MIPLVVLLDLDGTIVGNVSPIVCEWELIQMSGKRNKLKDFKKTVVQKLRGGLMRPHLADFCTLVQKHHGCVEYFIYTASDMTWANYLVPCLEEATGLTFHRPIFTRRHCSLKDGDYKKSIDSISPIIFRRLKTKYKDLTKPSQLKNRVCLIDNNEVLEKNEKNKLIRCPTYDFVDNYDVFSRIDIDTFCDQNCNNVASSLNKYGLFPSVPSSKTKSLTFDVFRYYYYNRLCENLKKSIKNNNTDNNYWLSIAYYLCKEDVKDFDSNTLKKINMRMSQETK